MHCISPRARAGLRMFAASIEPGVEPAPTMVCISSMKMMMLGLFSSSFMIARRRSSNCPRYFVPATTAVMSSAMIRLSNSMRDVLRSTMRCARPSTMADLPTPGSPIRMGLFFFLRLRICDMRSISFSRPTTGSSLPSLAAFVMSVPKLSSTGVSFDDLTCCVPAVCWFVLPLLPGSLSSSSSSLSVKPKPFEMLLFLSVVVDFIMSNILGYVTSLASRISAARLFFSLRIPSIRCSASATALKARASRVQKRRTLAVLRLISTFSSYGCSAGAVAIRLSMVSLSSWMFMFMLPRMSRALPLPRRMMPKRRCSGFMLLQRRRVASSLLSDNISVIFCDSSLLITLSLSLMNTLYSLFTLVSAKIVYKIILFALFLHKNACKKRAKLLIFQKIFSCHEQKQLQNAFRHILQLFFFISAILSVGKGSTTEDIFILRFLLSCNLSS